MKKIFSIFIVILTTICSLQAQELAVQSFVLAETDLTANTPGTMVEDQNGNVCALIKVETTVEGFSFDVGSLGVSQVKREGGEIWVYVPFGVRRITLSHPQLGVIRDYAFPCPIEKGRTYIMKLVTGSVRTVVEYAQTKQFLQIQLNPADAFLEINGKMKVTENGLYQELLPFGKYQYKAYYPEYHDLVGIVEVSDMENAHKLDLNLKAAFGYLSVLDSNNPEIAGASVYVDEKLIGKIPIRSFKASSGSHHIRILKEMYAPYNDTFVISDLKDTELAPELVPDFATVTIESVEGAEIYINGEYKGIHSWSGRLSYGSYIFETHKKGHVPYKMSYDVSEDDQGMVINLQGPTPVYGSVAIASTPSNAKIYVDGIYAGDTPKYISRQLIGEHKFSVELDGYQSQTKTLNITEGMDESLAFVLEPNPVGISGEIKDITVEHNVYNGDVKGMNILVDFDVRGMKGIDGKLSAYFYYQDGNKLMDTNQKYNAEDGHTAASVTFKPGYDIATYTDYKIFMPYSELEVGAGEHHLKFICNIWEYSSGSANKVAISQYVNFKLTKPEATPDGISGEIKDITVEHNVYNGDVKGMNILVDFDVRGMKGIDGKLSAYFYYQDGNKLMDTNQKYNAEDGHTAASVTFKPGYDIATYTDYKIFMPYSELEVGAGEHHLKFICNIWEYSSGSASKVAISQYVNFKLTK